MTQGTRFDDSGLGRAMRVWPALIAIISLIYVIGVSSASLNQLEKSQEQNCAQDAKQEARIVRLEQIAEEIPSVKADIKEILRRLPR